MKESKVLQIGSKVRTHAELDDNLVQSVHVKNMAARRPNKEGEVLYWLGNGVYSVQHEGEGCNDLPAAYHYSEFEVVEKSSAVEVDYAELEKRFMEHALNEAQGPIVDTGRTSYFESGHLSGLEDAVQKLPRDSGRMPTEPSMPESPLRTEAGKAFRQLAKEFKLSCEQYGHGWSPRQLIRSEVKALADRGNVTLEEWKNFRGNSYEMELIMPKLTNEALLYAGQHLVNNCQFERRRPWRSYNESVMGFLAPELLRRMQRISEEAISDHLREFGGVEVHLEAAADFLATAKRLEQQGLVTISEPSKARQKSDTDEWLRIDGTFGKPRPSLDDDEKWVLVLPTEKLTKCSRPDGEEFADIWPEG